MLQAVAVALHNPEGFRTFGQARLDVGRVLPERMSDESYRELLVRVHPAMLLVLLCWRVFKKSILNKPNLDCSSIYDDFCSMMLRRVNPGQLLL